MNKNIGIVQWINFHYKFNVLFYLGELTYKNRPFLFLIDSFFCKSAVAFESLRFKDNSLRQWVSMGNQDFRLGGWNEISMLSLGFLTFR